MSHFAQVNEKNQVLQVIVVHNNELTENGVESEAKGIAFCKSLLGEDSNWVQTSYNGNIRKNYAGVGYSYDATRDASIAPEPQGHIGFDEETCRWILPDVELD